MTAMVMGRSSWRRGAWASQAALGGGHLAGHAGVLLQGHAQGATEGLEDGLRLVVSVETLQVVDMQGDHAVVDEALEELPEQLGVQAADGGAGELHVHEQAGAAGEVHHDPGERRSEEHTSELQSRPHLVCRLLLEKKKRLTT